MQLNKLYEWWSDQRVVHLYSSSILLLYDAEILTNIESIKVSEKHSVNKWAKVYMIDFAHVHLPKNGELDYNYINGLKNLIKLLNSLWFLSMFNNVRYLYYEIKISFTVTCHSPRWYDTFLSSWRWPNGRKRSNNKNFTVELAHILPFISSWWTLSISTKRK